MKNSLANYPSKFLGCVVSNHKICLQFGDVTSKLRFKEGAEYVKMPDTVKAIPIKTTGTDVDILAVGCPLPVLFELQLKLVQACGEHISRFEDSLALDFLIHLQKVLDNEITQHRRTSADETIS